MIALLMIGAGVALLGVALRRPRRVAYKGLTNVYWDTTSTPDAQEAPSPGEG